MTNRRENKRLNKVQIKKLSWISKNWTKIIPRHKQGPEISYCSYKRESETKVKSIKTNFFWEQKGEKMFPKNPHEKFNQTPQLFFETYFLTIKEKMIITTISVLEIKRCVTSN